MPFAALTVDGSIATLTLSAPAAGVDREALASLRGVCEQLADAVDRVSVVVVASDGPDFAVRWSDAALAEGHNAFAGPLGAGVEALAGVPQPTIAAIDGRAHSIGLELALACDVRVAAEGASFAMPETALGLVPLAGGSQRLPRAVGRAEALRLLLLGDEIDAAEALRIGLVSRVVPSGAERDAATSIARAIAERGPIASRYAKEAVLRGVELPLQQGLRAELDMTIILQTTADRAEGVQAFVERREPKFTGR